MAYSNHAQSHTQIGTGHRKRNRFYKLRINVCPDHRQRFHIWTNHITTCILTYYISTHYTQSSPPNKKRKTTKHVTWTRDEIKTISTEQNVKSGIRRPGRARILEEHLDQFRGIFHDDICRCLHVMKQHQKQNVFHETYNGLHILRAVPLDDFIFRIVLNQ